MIGAASAPTVDLILTGDMKSGGYNGEMAGAFVGGTLGQVVDDVAAHAIDEFFGPTLANIGIPAGRKLSTAAVNAADAVSASETQDLVDGESPESTLDSTSRCGDADFMVPCR